MDLERSQFVADSCRRILKTAHEYHAARSPDFDFRRPLGSKQAVSDYEGPGQSAYIYQYLPKMLGVWSRIRSLLLGRLRGEAQGRPIWSVGSGPEFCLMGWFLEAAPMSNQRLVAVEPLSWSEFSKKYKLLELEKCLLGGRLPNLREEYFALTEECPEQMASFAGAPGLESLRPSGIDEGAIVLFPFSLNHMIPEVVEGEFWQTAAGTLERLRQRSTAIVIVESAGWPHYPDLQGALQSRGYARFCKNPMNEKLLAQPDILSAPDEVKRYNLYPDPDVTRYRAHRSYSEVRVLWADARGWHLSLERSG